MKGSGFLKQTNKKQDMRKAPEVSNIFRFINYLTFALSVMMDLQLITMIFILMSWSSSLVFEPFNRRFSTSFLIKEIPSLFISIACPIWIAAYHLKYPIL